MKNLKTSVTVIDSKLNIHFGNLFFLQVNGEQRTSVSKILNMKT